MEALTAEQKSAGREFVDERVAAFEALPPADLYPPGLIHHLRHLCAKAGKSVSFEMKEVYQPSDDGLFAFVYREGRCHGCGQTGRSRSWRLVDARERPPLGRS